MGVGPTTIAEDGTIVGGNGRFEAISQAYDQGKAADYRARLEADAITKGIDPTTFAGMKKPVLVRRITQPFDTRSLAVASNSGGSLQYSALELAKIDGERMATLGDIEVNDTGDIEMTVANMQNVRRALAGYGAAELGSMSDKDGMLSQEGIRRIKNAMLYKAYGNSPTLSRLVETTDNEMRSVSGALVRAAGAVASVRADMADGAIPSKTDIAADLVVAVELLIKIKSSGGSVEQYLAQHGLFKGEYTEAAATILRFLSENIRSQKKMADFIRAYYDAIASEDTKTGSMFEELAPATKQERLNHAKQQTEAGQAETAGRPTGIADAQDQQQPESAKGAAAGGGEGQQAAVTGDGTQAAPILTSPTKEEITQREHEADQRKADEDAQAKKEQADKDAADVAARTKSRTDNADNFQFGESSKDAAKPMGGLFDQSNQEAKTEPFDSEAWNKKRDDTIKASKQSGNVHLDQVPVAVETMRGKEITYAHDLKEKGVIRTVDNRGSVLVYWSDKYSADKEMANEKKEKKKTVFESWLGPTDLKDYVFTDPQDLRRYAKTEPASNDAAKADADIEAALFDLGAIMRDVAGVQRLLPEDRPKVMAVLVRLFDAAFRKGYYDIKDAAKYVRKLLSENESVKALLNHITTGMMNEAAQQAADNMPAGFFDNQGLFAQAAPETKAEASPAETKSNVITISDIPKSLKIQLESMVDGRTKRKLVSARKAMFAANQRVEKLEVLRKCL
ncbi:MAG: hypothetical protein A2V79_09160 [Betaproteobacteria bacterium RBG_16_56_24]|nr:MAG: hypothetical protein A2V79_09160 [Betaproteobacteria bacterium RBG_16_56_24]